jgi:uncharacterized protein
VQNAQLQIIRQSSFMAAPWRNGGGVTHEALRVPAGGDPFRWRVSVAHIGASGPFSDFPAYQRNMVLLQGAGIELRFGGALRRTLRQVGELVEFDGAVPTYCELLNGPCVDLNLMVIKSETAVVRVERLVEPLPVSASGDETALVFPIDGKIALQTAAGATAALESWDLAVLSQCAAQITALESARSTAATAVFIATLSGLNTAHP